MADQNGANPDLGIIRVPRQRPVKPRHSGRGWMTFAGVVLLLGAAFNAAYGLAAIYNDDYVAEEELLYGSVTVWGWLAVGFAVVGVVVALMLFAGSPYGALLAILIAGLNAVAHLIAIEAHTLWSVIVIAVDGLIIYGLVFHTFGRGRRAVER